MPGVFASDDANRSFGPRPPTGKRKHEGGGAKEDRVMKDLQAGNKALAIGDKKRIKVSKKR